MKEEFEKLNNLYQVAQEDLQIKIEEIGKTLRVLLMLF
jgi:hypothetical protein